MTGSSITFGTNQKNDARPAVSNLQPHYSGSTFYSLMSGTSFVTTTGSPALDTRIQPDNYTDRYTGAIQYDLGSIAPDFSSYVSARSAYHVNNLTTYANDFTDASAEYTILIIPPGLSLCGRRTRIDNSRASEYKRCSEYYMTTNTTRGNQNFDGASFLNHRTVS